MKKIDLSQGNIRKLVVRTAVPMVVAQFVSMLYNIVDRIFVGRIPGIGAVALGGIALVWSHRSKSSLCSPICENHQHGHSLLHADNGNECFY